MGRFCALRDEIKARTWKQGSLRCLLSGYCLSMLRNETQGKIFRDTHPHFIFLHAGKLFVHHNNLVIILTVIRRCVLPVLYSLMKMTI